MRLIDAEQFESDLITHNYGAEDIYVEDIFDELHTQPTVDAVRVVRCEDCQYWEQATPNSGNCNRALEITAYANDYCSYGKRRNE